LKVALNTIKQTKQTKYGTWPIVWHSYTWI
jgi:hypothetical protein